jgi:ABC-type Mn2+/Zn2+ transport system ATPase subunit
MILVEARDALFGYPNRPVVAVEALRVQPGGRLGLFGPNGCGKTTLVHGLTGLLPALGGRVARPAGLRVGYLPQHRSTDLQWPMNGADAASMALSARRRGGMMTAADRERIDQKARVLEVADLVGRPFASLSGGQQQRMLLAGALAAEPQLLVLDEPTEGLDVRSRAIFLEALRRAAAEGLSTIMISHSIDDLVALCETIARFLPAEDASRPSRIEIVSASDLAP